MPTFFHITPTRNIPAIIMDGLLARIGPRSQELGEPAPAVYLFRTLEAAENALGNWLGDAFDEDERLALLSVSIPNDIEDDPATFEFCVFGDIPRDRIEVLSMDLDEVTDFNKFQIDQSQSSELRP